MGNINSKKSRIINGIVVWLLTVALVVLTGYMVICNVYGRVPMLFGYGIVRLKSGSMSPTIPTDSYILIKKTDPAKIFEGDVITFYSDVPEIAGYANTHRVTKVISNSNGSIEFETKGDANLIADRETAKGDKLIGKYVKTLPVLTAVFGFINNGVVYWIIIIVVMAASVIMFVKAAKSDDVKEKEHDRMLSEELERLRNGGSSEDTQEKGK